jgi:hypothetical protein
MLLSYKCYLHSRWTAWVIRHNTGMVVWTCSCFRSYELILRWSWPEELFVKATGRCEPLSYITFHAMISSSLITVRPLPLHPIGMLHFPKSQTSSNRLQCGVVDTENPYAVLKITPFTVLSQGHNI